MSSLAAEQLLEQLRWRYAVKRFDASRKLSDSIWAALEQAMILAPSSFGLQPWRFVVITDPKVKSQLPALSWGQPQPNDCSHMVVLAARRTMDADYVDAFLASVVALRGGSVEKLGGLKSSVLSSVKSRPDRVQEWNTFQVYLALGQLLTSAAVLGVDACPMEGIDQAAYDKLLGLDQSDYTTKVGCALGYRHPEDRNASMKKVRFEPQIVVQHI